MKIALCSGERIGSIEQKRKIITRDGHRNQAIPKRLDPSNDHLRGVVSALSAAQRRLIEQLFWQERTETEVAAAMGINQSTINRRKQAILNGLRMKMRDRNEFRTFSA